MLTYLAPQAAYAT